MYILILILPFLGFLLPGLFGRYFGRLGSSYLSILNIFMSMILSFFLFYEVCLCQSVVSIKLYNWILLDIYNIHFGLLFDTVSVIMILVITIISFLVHLYSTTYMHNDPYITRFMSYLSLFTFFMLILVTSDNYFQLFIGWEGVGLCSYLLINFWFTRLLANKAALKAMIVNRIADVFFIIAILLLFITFKTTDYILIFNLLPYIYNENIIFLNIIVNKINLITIFLFIGSIGKSAQIGFHTWLPDAMEGPTPVSALLHAATMVTAGVFLIIRSSLFFEYTDKALTLLCIFGAITALFGSIVASFQYDIKKIIAYSTTSQLGYMFFSCGLSNYYVAFSHLFNHAFFKALLFLSAGALIHTLFDEQDIRKMGFLITFLPFIYLSILIGSLSIMGFPFLSGFYSKDLILELTYSRFLIESLYIYILAVLSAIFTAIYSFKIIFYVFLLKRVNYNKVLLNIIIKNKEKINNIIVCLIFLILFSIVTGYFFKEMFIGYGSNFWNNSIYIYPHHFFFIEIEFIHPLIKNLPIILSFFNISIFYILLNINYTSRIYFIFNNIYFIKISSFFYYALFFNKIYNLLYINIFKYSYLVTSKYIDKGILEILGPYGLYKSFKYLYLKVNSYVLSLLFYHLFIIFISLFIFINIIIILFIIDINLLSNNITIFIFLLLIFIFNLWNNI